MTSIKALYLGFGLVKGKGFKLLAIADLRYNCCISGTNFHNNETNIDKVIKGYLY